MDDLIDDIKGPFNACMFKQTCIAHIDDIGRLQRSLDKINDDCVRAEEERDRLIAKLAAAELEIERFSADGE